MLLAPIEPDALINCLPFSKLHIFLGNRLANILISFVKRNARSPRSYCFESLFIAGMARSVLNMHILNLFIFEFRIYTFGGYTTCFGSNPLLLIRFPVSTLTTLFSMTTWKMSRLRVAGELITLPVMS